MQDRIPIIEGLQKYIREEIIPFHMPGHKMGKGMMDAEWIRHVARMDVTEVPGLDDLHQADGIIRHAQKLAARAFGSDASFFLVNGSTCGIYAMIMAACKPGDMLLVPRNCHKSVWNAMALAGVRPVYIQPGYDPEQLLPTQVSADQVREAVSRNPELKGMILTHPNYYGMCSDIHMIEDILHGQNKLLLVDEAHGAHLVFHPDLPPSAGEAGADCWIQSAHKTLPAFTQASYLHSKGQRIDPLRLSRAVSMYQSTSPSYILMASLDWARYWMAREGRTRLSLLRDILEDFKKKLERDTGIKTLDQCRWDEVAFMDWTRLVLDVSVLDLTGYQAETLLRREGIQVEMADWRHVVLICTAVDDKAAFDGLLKACRSLADKNNKNSKRSKDSKDNKDSKHRLMKFPVPFSQNMPRQVMLPGELLYRPLEEVPLEQSAGRVCAAALGAYPPGIPRFCPGELLDKQGIEELEAIRKWGGKLFGLTQSQRVPVLAHD